MEKALKELTLLDKFLFDQTMDIPEAHEAALQIIFGDETLQLLNETQTEKEFRTAPWLRSIRLDVFTMDNDKNIYDTEMQGWYRNDLIKRSRYYLGLIDSSLLEPGAVNFNKLNDVFLIMIMPFDLFGKGKYCYTFHTWCDEEKDLQLKDGATRIFLNTRGKYPEGVSQELIDFLRYIETTDGTFAKQTGSRKIQKIHECVQKIKSSEEMGVKYMQSWEEKIIEREQGKAEGKAESILQVLEELGEVPEELKTTILAQQDMELLTCWLKLAAKADKVEEFQKRMEE